MNLEKADIQIHHSETLFHGHAVHLVRDEFTYRGKRMQRETVKHPGAVVLLPVLDDGRIIFVKQYRHAVRGYLLELPAGTLAPQEDPLDCAKRELAEETGWHPGKITCLLRFFTAPGFVSELMHLYLAEQLTEREAQPDEDEFLLPVTLTLEEALAKIDAGIICDAKTIIGLLLYAKQRSIVNSG